MTGLKKVIEFKLSLGIQPIFRLKDSADIEVFLQSNLTTISVDSKAYLDDRNKFRLNFTLAYEAGHLILHADQYKQMNFESQKYYIEFQQRLDPEEISLITNREHPNLLSI